VRRMVMAMALSSILRGEATLHNAGVIFNEKVSLNNYYQ